MSISGIGWIPERLNNKSTYGAKNSEKYFQIFGKILSKIRIPDLKTLFLTEGGAARLESASGDRLCEASLKRPGRFTKTIIGYHKLWHFFFGFSSF